MKENFDVVSRVLKKLMVDKYNSGFVEQMISEVYTMLKNDNSSYDKNLKRFLLDCSREIAHTYYSTDDKDFKDDLVDVEEIVDALLMI